MSMPLCHGPLMQCLWPDMLKCDARRAQVLGRSSLKLASMSVLGLPRCSVNAHSVGIMQRHFASCSRFLEDLKCLRTNLKMRFVLSRPHDGINYSSTPCLRHSGRLETQLTQLITSSKWGRHLQENKR